MWFEPREVWEIRGADLTISPVHRAAIGCIEANRDRGVSLRPASFSALPKEASRLLVCRRAAFQLALKEGRDELRRKRQCTLAQRNRNRVWSTWVEGSRLLFKLRIGLLSPALLLKCIQDGYAR